MLHLLLHNLVDALRTSDQLLATRLSAVAVADDGVGVAVASAVLETISDVAKVEVYILKNVFLSGARCRLDKTKTLVGSVHTHKR